MRASKRVFDFGIHASIKIRVLPLPSCSATLEKGTHLGADLLVEKPPNKQKSDNTERLDLEVRLVRSTRVNANPITMEVIPKMLAQPAETTFVLTCFGEHRALTFYVPHLFLEAPLKAAQTRKGAL